MVGNSAIFAGAMGAGTLESVNSDQHTWSFGAQANYLAPTYSVDYLTAFTTNATTANFNSLDPDWNWGFKLEGGYQFNTDNDINVNWSHFDETTSRTILLTTIPSGITFNADTQVKPRWDAVNAEYGQNINFGERKNIRFHGGGQYAWFKTTVLAAPAGTVFSDQLTTKFNGVGPRVGADLAYDWRNGIVMYAKGATALLIGTASFNTNTASVLSAAGSSNGSKRQMVPELEGQLGISYTYPLSQGDVKFDAGYLWLNYFDSQNIRTFSREGGTSDFALSGPYVGLKWMS